MNKICLFWEKLFGFNILRRILSSFLFSLLVILSVSAGMVKGQTTPNPALLVGEKSGDLLTIVDPESYEIIKRIPANANPHEVATTGRYAYVSNTGAGSITVIDLESQSLVEGIDLAPLSPIHGLWIAGGKLYFANESSRTIGRYDPDSEEIDWVLGTGQPQSHMIVVSSDEQRIFTTNMGPGTASILERTEEGSGWELTVIPTGPRAEGIDVSPDGRELWVSNVNNSTISVIDVGFKQIVETLSLNTKFSNRLRFTPDGRRVFVADLQGNEVLVFDRETREEVARIDVGGGSEGMQMTPDGTRVFVSVSTAGKVVEIDLRTLKVTGEIKGFNNPDGLAWSARD